MKWNMKLRKPKKNAILGNESGIALFLITDYQFKS